MSRVDDSVETRQKVTVDFGLGRGKRGVLFCYYTEGGGALVVSTGFFERDDDDDVTRSKTVRLD